MDDLWILVKVLFGEIDQLNNVVEIGFVWQASFKRPDLLSRLLEMSLLEILVVMLTWCDCLFSYRIACSFSFFVGWRWHGRDAGKSERRKVLLCHPQIDHPPKRATDDGNTNSEIKLTCRHASLQEKAAMDDDGMKAQALTSREQTAEISVKNMFMQFTLWACHVYYRASTMCHCRHHPTNIIITLSTCTYSQQPCEHMKGLRSN